MNLSINIKMPDSPDQQPVVHVETANECAAAVARDHVKPRRFQTVQQPAAIVVDSATNLMWDAAGNENRMTHKEAEEYAKKLTLGGFTDWRLPTIQELLTLVDYSRREPAIDTEAFPSCQSSWYWTSTPVAANPGCAWFVDFGYGASNWNSRGNYNHVRAVRASQ